MNLRLLTFKSSRAEEERNYSAKLSSFNVDKDQLINDYRERKVEYLVVSCLRFRVLIYIYMYIFFSFFFF